MSLFYNESELCRTQINKLEVSTAMNIFVTSAIVAPIISTGVLAGEGHSHWGGIKVKTAQHIGGISMLSLLLVKRVMPSHPSYKF